MKFNWTSVAWNPNRHYNGVFHDFDQSGKTATSLPGSPPDLNNSSDIIALKRQAFTLQREMLFCHSSACRDSQCGSGLKDQAENGVVNYLDTWVCAAWFQSLIKRHKNHLSDVTSSSLNRRLYCILIDHYTIWKLASQPGPEIVQFLLSSSPGKCHQHYTVTTA